MRLHRIGIAALALASCIAGAQDVPPPETGTAKFNSRLVSGKLEVREISSGVAVVVPKYPLLDRFPASVQTNVELRAQPTGCDLVVTATNTGDSPAELGHIAVGILNLGQNIDFFDFRATSESLPCEWNSYIPSGWAYPNDLYSPVFVVRNATYAVGVSMQYPIMDYKHDVLEMMNAGRGELTGGEGGPGWLCDFGLGHPYNNAVQTWAMLPPGQTWTYVVSVRITRSPQEWQTTLLPYRNYFRAKFGGVKYRRETTPIFGAPLADPAYLGPDNPFGFQTQFRPDVNGWSAVRAMMTRDLAGWPTVVLWAPSGLYRNNLARNYPYQFTSHWDATPRLAEVYNATDGLPSVAATGRKFGLWWGNAAQVSFEWDSPTFENFDPDNASHVTAAFREMDGAARTGATVIGLDTFMPDLCPLWKSYAWIQTLQSRYPQMKFCTETSSCDIMHTIAPTFVPGWQMFSARPADTTGLIIIKHPNYLADFINPGHETWGQISYQEQRRWFGNIPNNAEITRQMNNFASYGYRVLMSETIPAPAPGGALAARTWETSLPASVRDSDPYIADIRAGRLPGQGGGTPPPVGGSPPPGGSPSGGGALLPPLFRRAPAPSSNTSPTSAMITRRGQNGRVTVSRGRQGIIPHYVVQYSREPQPQQ